MRILLVDDDLNMRVLISALLRQLWNNVQLDVASGGEEALQKLSSSGYDVVLTDVQMPEMDGYATAVAIRQMPPPQCHIKIICMTGGKISMEKVQQCGIDGYLLKPFSLSDLRLKFSEVLAVRDKG
jgi:CheY-like chemotaxis protein